MGEEAVSKAHLLTPKAESALNDGLRMGERHLRPLCAIAGRIHN